MFFTCLNRFSKAGWSSTFLSISSLLNTSLRTRFAIILCTTFVRSRQSMQFVRKTPSWAEISDPSLINKKYPICSWSWANRSIKVFSLSHLRLLHSAWKSKASYRTFWLPILWTKLRYAFSSRASAPCWLICVFKSITQLVNNKTIEYCKNKNTR